MNKILNIFTDGGSRGNPGPAAIGVYVTDEKGKELYRIGKRIGQSTNNEAEYTAVLEALKWLKENFEKIFFENNAVINFFLDSQLVVNQLNGSYKIKKMQLKEMAINIKIIEKEINGKIIYNFLGREKNKMADFLVNTSFKNL